jgi:hypothetical protein
LELDKKQERLNSLASNVSTTALKTYGEEEGIAGGQNPAIRVSVGRLFNVHSKFQVVGEPEHGREALDWLRVSGLTSSSWDLAMPIMTGLEAAPLLIRILPNDLAPCFRLLESKIPHRVSSLPQRVLLSLVAG